MSYYLERIQRGVDFIEAHLDEEVELSRVAKEGGLSQWHFQRIFKALTGETLKTYIRSRRLASSLDRLLSTKLRILDIALLAGFESQEAFARAFKTAFELTPQQYRDLGKKSLFLKKPEFDAAYLEQLTRNESLAPELYTQPRLTLVGLRTQFFSVDSRRTTSVSCCLRCGQRSCQACRKWSTASQAQPTAWSDKNRATAIASSTTPRSR